MFSLYTLSFRESWGNLSFSSFEDKTSTNYLWVSLIPSESEMEPKEESIGLISSCVWTQ